MTVYIEIALCLAEFKFPQVLSWKRFILCEDQIVRAGGLVHHVGHGCLGVDFSREFSLGVLLKLLFELVPVLVNLTGHGASLLP